MVNLQTEKSSIVLSIVRIARPIHWIKNLSIFAAIFLTGLLFEKSMFVRVAWSFVAFSFLSSGIYIINDILDAKVDRLHPQKKFRPIANGSLPIPIALLESFIFIFFALTIAFSINQLLFMLMGAYLIMQLLYSVGLKNIAILDILIIASGFIMRVYAGAFVIDAHLSVWFLLCVVSVALFLASGKRRAELNIVHESEPLTRKSLSNYKKDLLNSYVTMFGNASWMSWALFTFFESPKAALPFWLVLAELSKTTTINKLLMLTIPVTIFGIMRYQALIFEGRSETPEKLLLTDKPLIIVSLLWVLIVYWVLYSGITVTGI
ncbi:MAG: decaprenyl-phosphate phosphoribosyltransferase [Patescibacteria group bacterium]